MHLSDEALRAYFDRDSGVGAQLAHKKAAAHLEMCPTCRKRLSAIEGRSQRVAAGLGLLDPDRSSLAKPAPVALQAYYARHPRPAQEENPSMFATLFSRRLRPIWAVTAVLLVFVVTTSIQPVRAWASNVLRLFRVQQVTVLPIDMTQLTALEGNQALGSEISKYVSDSVTVTKDPGDPFQVADVAEATQSAGFAVRLPEERTDSPELLVRGSGSFEFTADRAKMVAVLDELGYADVDLPASIDGALIKIQVPAAVTAGYGECPDLLSEGVVDGMNAQPTSSMRNCVVLSQFPSPTVDAPADLDIERLAEIGLQLGGMQPDQAKEFSQTVDWTTTLVVPIPRNGSRYTTVTVDGVTGYMIQRTGSATPQYALIWVKDGIVYAIGAQGTDTSAALAMANSMK